MFCNDNFKSSLLSVIDCTVLALSVKRTTADLSVLFILRTNSVAALILWQVFGNNPSYAEEIPELILILSLLSILPEQSIVRTVLYFIVGA